MSYWDQAKEIVGWTLVRAIQLFFIVLFLAMTAAYFRLI